MPLIAVAAGRLVPPSLGLMSVARDALQRFVKLGEVRGLTEGAPADIRNVRKRK